MPFNIGTWWWGLGGFGVLSCPSYCAQVFAATKGLVFSCCGVKLQIDFKLCGLKQDKVFCPLEKGPAIGNQGMHALNIILFWY